MRPSSGARLAVLLGIASAALGACQTLPSARNPPLTSPSGHASAPSGAAFSPPPMPPQGRLTQVRDLPGWAEEDHLAALRAFQVGCGAARGAAWRAVCARARAQTAEDEPSAKAFFEDNFKAEGSLPAAFGLLTAYFAPEYPAETVPDEIFTAPLRPKPDNLQMVDPGPGDTQGRKTCRQILDEDLLSCPDRAAIEADPSDHALAFMKPEDLFFLQIQGSGDLVFPDGHRMKAVYAADNGRPFIGIAKPMMEEGLLPVNGSSGDAIRAWLADHRGPEANAVMDKDPRYVFFNLVRDDDGDPAGAAGIALPAGRAIAVDPAYHGYGELYWIDAKAPVLSGAAKTYRRLAVALDTGSAIRGDVRADLYMGRGDQAGSEAGHVRHALSLIRLVPVSTSVSATRLSETRAVGAKDEKTP
jgi:membrane-bound lytic murein transglycosylase A